MPAVAASSVDAFALLAGAWTAGEGTCAFTVTLSHGDAEWDHDTVHGDSREPFTVRLPGR